MRRVLAAAALAILLSGCASGGTPVSTPSTGRPPFQTVSPSPSPSVPTQVPANRWAAILADLAGRGVATDDVQVVSAASVTWPNGALGCAKPGVSYTQALIDGMKVVVSAGGKSWDYRFGNGDTPKLCEGSLTKK